MQDFHMPSKCSDPRQKLTQINSHLRLYGLSLIFLFHSHFLTLWEAKDKGVVFLMLSVRGSSAELEVNPAPSIPCPSSLVY